MINFTNSLNTVTADNKVVIGGLTYMLTDDEAIKLNDIIKGMISTRNTTNTKSLSNTLSQPEPSTKTTTKKDFKNPDLGKPTATIGKVTVYNETMVRYWECGFVPDKVKYGIKMSLNEAGATWDKANGCFTFKTKKACAEWCKAQKARQK